MRIKLTEAQESALECRADGLDPLTAEAWNGNALVFRAEDANALFSELCEASNAEDAHAELLRGSGERQASTLTGRAARSLAALSGRVLREGGPQ